MTIYEQRISQHTCLIEKEESLKTPQAQRLEKKRKKGRKEDKPKPLTKAK
jgi:hypothetical protein